MGAGEKSIGLKDIDSRTDSHQGREEFSQLDQENCRGQQNPLSPL